MDEARGNDLLEVVQTFDEECLRKAQGLRTQAIKRLERSVNLVAPLISKFLEHNFPIVFADKPDERLATREEKKAFIALLSVFASNNYPSEEKEKEVLRYAGGVEVIGDCRVNKEGQDFLVIQSNGRAAGGRELIDFLARTGISGDDYETVAVFLGKGRGNRLLVWDSDQGIILGAKHSPEGISLSTPALARPFEIETKGPSAIIIHLADLIKTPFYPPQLQDSLRARFRGRLRPPQKKANKKSENF